MISAREIEYMKSFIEYAYKNDDDYVNWNFVNFIEQALELNGYKDFVDDVKRKAREKYS